MQSEWKSRIDFKIILLTLKAIHGQAPAYICELVNLKPNSSYGPRSNNKMLLSTLNFRTLPTLGGQGARHLKKFLKIQISGSCQERGGGGGLLKL